MNNELRYFIRNFLLNYNEFRTSSYYPIIFPAVISLVSIILFGVFVLPHLQDWFSIQAEIEQTQKKITVMKENGRLLQNIDTVLINDEYAIATKALPHEKDFISILETIGQAALKSNVQVNDYSFSIGKISDEKKTVDVETINSTEITLTLFGTVNDVVSFVDTIERSLPLAEVKGIEYSGDKAKVRIVFFVKIFPDVKIDTSVPLTQLSQKDKELLNILRGWSLHY